MPRSYVSYVTVALPGQRCGSLPGYNCSSDAAYIMIERLFHTCFFLLQNLDLYVYKNSIKTSDIGFTAKVGDSNTKFEIWFRKRKPGDTYTLVSMSEDIKQAWTDELSNLLWKQALRNRGTYRD